MKSRHKLNLRLDTQELKQALVDNPDLFGQYNQRGSAEGSPHREMTDIWIRYKDIKPHLESGDFSTFGDEHDSVWYSSSNLLPVKRLLFQIMAEVDGERLGGVLITKLPPHGVIHPHIDGGWHAGYYDKYYVPIQSSKGDVFGFEDGDVIPSEGDVWWFNNSVVHWVKNETDNYRFSLIVCIKTENRLGE